MLDNGAGGDLDLANAHRNHAIAHRYQTHSRFLQGESHWRMCDPARVLPTNGLPSKLGGSV